MPVAKKVFNGMGDYLLCCWDTCDRPGYELYKIVIHEHKGRCDQALPENHVNMVFCSERHRQYHANSHNDNGKLPPGFRLAI